MTKTICEKLRDKIGLKVPCVTCQKKKVFNNKWMLNSDKEPVCPNCIKTNLDNGKVMVSIF